MKGRKLLSLFMILGIASQFSACTAKEEKKIILQESVTKNILELENGLYKEGKVEKIELYLEEGDYFIPSYYENGEVYGHIGWGEGVARSSKEVREKRYPLHGMIKANLYKIGRENKIEETSRGAEEVFVKSDNELQSVIDGLLEKYDGTSVNSVNNISERYASIVINMGRWKGKYKAFLYDREEKNIYFNDEHEIEYTTSPNSFKHRNSFKYIEGIDAIIYVDNTLTSYKVKLDGNSYSLEKYANFGKVDILESFSIASINEYEILITNYKCILKGGGYESDPLEEITSIHKYDFDTNQLTTLFEKQEGTTVDGYYVGENIYIIEEFKVQEKNILPLKRYFYEVKEDGMKLILEENIENEGERNHPGGLAKVSEDGKEIFMTIYITEWYTWNKNDNITVDAIYKKYRLEDNDI